MNDTGSEDSGMRRHVHPGMNVPYQGALRFLRREAKPTVFREHGGDDPPHASPRRFDTQAKSIVIAIAAAVIVAGSIAVFKSPYSPMIAAGTVAALAMLAVGFQRPAWSLYAALFVILIPPGIIPEQVHSFLNRSLTIIALVTWLFDAIRRHTRWKWTLTASLMAGFILWAAVTVSWAENVPATQTYLQLYMFRFILFLFLLPNVVRTEKDLNGVMNALALCGWFLVLVSAGVIISGGYTPMARFKPMRANANELGLAMLVTLPGVLWQALRPENRHRTTRNLTASLFLVAAIVLVALSGSRGTAISLCVTLLALWLWKATRRYAKQGLVILLLGMTLFPFVFATTLSRFAGNLGSDTPLGGREVLWQEAWNVIKENPLTGVGIGNSAYVIRSALGAYGEDERVPIHNPVLVIWVETGIPGILLFLGTMIAAVWSFAGQYQSCRRLGGYWLLPYFALMASVFLGFLFSWIKGGAIETSHTHFLFLSLLLIPSSLDITAPALAPGNGTYQPRVLRQG